MTQLSKAEGNVIGRHELREEMKEKEETLHENPGCDCLPVSCSSPIEESPPVVTPCSPIEPPPPVSISITLSIASSAVSSITTTLFPPTLATVLVSTNSGVLNLLHCGRWKILYPFWVSALLTLPCALRAEPAEVEFADLLSNVFL